MRFSDFLRPVAIASSLAGMLCACQHGFKSDNYTAYFGGEVINPTSPYVMFCREGEVIDSLKLDENNRFFIKFDSLTPGMYSFRNDPEYQYVYFDKNDSIMVRMNARDFDNSIVFCGRGDQKNNFLMELYLKNEQDKATIFDVFDDDVNGFLTNIDSAYQSKQKFYAAKKAELKWGEDFDRYARASLDYTHYAKKEIYPRIHEIRTGQDVTEALPEHFYNFRKSINFSDDELSNYAPYVAYLTHMLNNVSAIHYHNHYTEADLSLRTNINKLNVADTLIKNEKVRNIVLNNIAFTYLLEDQNMANNHKFLEIYHKYSTDKSKRNEILKLGNAIQQLTPGKSLPDVELVYATGKTVSSKTLTNKKTVLFFWTDKLVSHLTTAHKKVLELRAKHPDFQFVAVSLDKDQDKWVSTLSRYRTDGIIELRAANFEQVRDQWAITKVHRTIILGEDGAISNAFTNLFDVHFERELELHPQAESHEHALAAK